MMDIDMEFNDERKQGKDLIGLSLHDPGELEPFSAPDAERLASV